MKNYIRSFAEYPDKQGVWPDQQIGILRLHQQELGSHLLNYPSQLDEIFSIAESMGRCSRLFQVHSKHHAHGVQ